MPSSTLIRSSTITPMSSAGLRVRAAIDGGASSRLTDSACAPRRPSTTLNSTRAPPLTAVVPDGSEELGRNTSPPSSELMKPNPLAESYHLTLPVGTGEPLASSSTWRRARRDLRARFRTRLTGLSSRALPHGHGGATRPGAEARQNRGRGPFEGLGPAPV